MSDMLILCYALQNLNWRWTFYVLIIWVFVVLAALFFVSALLYCKATQLT